MTAETGAGAGPVEGLDWAARVATELVASGLAWVDRIPGSRTWRAGTFHAFVCGHPYATFKGLVASGPGDVADLDAALDRVVASGLPHLLRMRHGVDPAADARLAERGYQLIETAPAMVLADAAGLAWPDVPGLEIEQVRGPAGIDEHLDVACAAFDGPRELTATVTTPALLSDPRARCYVGRVDGHPVTTATSYRTSDSVGVYSVGTSISLRGNGYGSAITARAVAEGVRDGAGWAYLVSSTLGYRPYERLGFVTVDEWDLWVPSSAS